MRVGMSIRPYQVVDGPAVAAIIRAAWPDDPVMQGLQATQEEDLALPDAWLLSDVGVAGQDRPHARELTGALVAHCPTYAASHQRIVEFEVDDSHVHLWAVLETLPVVGATHDLVVMADG